MHEQIPRVVATILITNVDNAAVTHGDPQARQWWPLEMHLYHWPFSLAIINETTKHILQYTLV